MKNFRTTVWGLVQPRGRGAMLALGAILLFGWTLAAAPSISWARVPKTIRGKVGPFPKRRWPGPLKTIRYIDLKLAYRAGTMRAVKISHHRFRSARQIKRYVGRFLAKLYQGAKLRDVLPFNVPLLAPVENYTPTGSRIMRSLTKHSRIAISVRLPYWPGMDRIEIVDVTKQKRWVVDLRAGKLVARGGRRSKQGGRTR